MRQTHTCDKGKEMARHRELDKATGVRVYFCDPHSPWQRGSCENTNGLLRQFLPKGTHLSVHDQQALDSIADTMHNRPRETLGKDPLSDSPMSMTQPMTTLVSGSVRRLTPKRGSYRQKHLHQVGDSSTLVVAITIDVHTGAQQHLLNVIGTAPELSSDRQEGGKQARYMRSRHARSTFFIVQITFVTKARVAGTYALARRDDVGFHPAISSWASR